MNDISVRFTVFFRDQPSFACIFGLPKIHANDFGMTSVLPKPMRFHFGIEGVLYNRSTPKINREMWNDASEMKVAKPKITEIPRGFAVYRRKSATSAV